MTSNNEREADDRSGNNSTLSTSGQEKQSGPLRVNHCVQNDEICYIEDSRDIVMYYIFIVVKIAVS